MRTRCQRNTIINDIHAVGPAQGVAQLLARVIVIITEVWLRVGTSAYANGLADSMAKARDTRGGRMTSIARHKLDAASMVRVLILWARQHFGLDGAETVQDDSCGRSISRIFGNALDSELNKLRRIARVRKPGYRTSSASMAKEIAEPAKCVSSARWQATISARMTPREKMSVERSHSWTKEDLGRHMCICTAKVRRWDPSLLRAAMRANPKTVTLRRPDLSR